MKKFAATILSFLYLVASTGATIHMHYCMGQLKYAGLWHSTSKENACPNCGMTKKKGCCEDKHKTVKIEKQYDIQPSAIAFTKYNTQHTHYSFIYYHPTFIPALVIDYPLTNSPPGLQGVPLYIANCVYRI